ncbi:hypothetical protein FOE74_11985 [Rufibacter glacialis]|uniref:Lipoprotein n=1 Tax=Rufibacter glacialis TaxID=1259555 RepID=A0A5M8QDN2_9BACT|nr:hypothetical protein FOE74_11985 [Rufibacter glacialis]
MRFFLLSSFLALGCLNWVMPVLAPACKVDGEPQEVHGIAAAKCQEETSERKKRVPAVWLEGAAKRQGF